MVIGMDEFIPYCGPPPGANTLLANWNLDPLAVGLVVLVMAGGLYARGSLRITGHQPAYAAIASLGLAIAFISPLCALTVALFSARSLHHLVLLCIVAPALALAFRQVRFPDGAGVAAFAAVSLILWSWHVPAIYSAAWNSHFIYWIMQFLLIASGFAFWASIFRSEGSAGQVRAALLLAALAGQMGLIGAILTFSGNILYSEHMLLTDAFGLSALGDQQLAGLVMWVPGMIPLAWIAALILRRGWREVSAA
ncbi:cytochrome c oxidase assembly protein [Hyphomonas sp. NPDC076900]|uniref:cytochrome c oxidase assembly protein n=1 Tax=unclassified Hyphomonas TaxID=2630699 RepID=UPI003CFD341B